MGKGLFLIAFGIVGGAFVVTGNHVLMWILIGAGIFAAFVPKSKKQN